MQLQNAHVRTRAHTHVQCTHTHTTACVPALFVCKVLTIYYREEEGMENNRWTERGCRARSFEACHTAAVSGVIS